MPSWDRRGQRAEERGEWGGTKQRERSEPPCIFAKRSLLKSNSSSGTCKAVAALVKGCGIARLQRMLAALALFGTTPLASFLGSSAPPIPGSRAVQIPVGQIAEIQTGLWSRGIYCVEGVVFENVKPGIPLLGKGGVDATSRNIAKHPLKVADGVVGSSHR